ncbi:ferrochelatase [Alicyclobacillus cellulosilyticus]|uniref:Coproporphyrin III ferrochelatase n=1 Tax=Alicyclobacillus cellulosilyticus TaxID=1003997 RepID=A0A917KAF7_9BACL|nr:ferrochelatase [Alicyclobacillus cellulosilyticus]GGJ05927.1 ferrochelatase [Alicyclobacillus cellulosilyticus]
MQPLSPAPMRSPQAHDRSPIGVLVMAYGSPRSLAEVEAYYTHIRRGRPPTPEQLADLVARYRAIGGVSPLRAITLAQADGIARFLADDPDDTYRVYLGMKHAEPFIDQVVQAMYADGIREAVTLVLAPHYSSMSVRTYQEAAEAAAVRLGGPKLLHVDHWHLEPDFLDLLARRVADAMRAFPDRDRVMVVFTAHSLPERILTVGDPYPRQIRETGEAVAERLGLRHFAFAWQSAGRTAEPWLGPDILELLPTLRADGWNDVIVCPAGFVADHLEVLYDIDIECQRLAQRLGMQLVRTASLNADPAFCRMLARVVQARARQGGMDA